MRQRRLIPVILYLALAFTVSAITPQRYVLRSEGSRLPAVLGYADSVSEQDFELPPALVEWMSQYDASEPLVPPVCDDSVKPLLQSRWAQSVPFNDSVPTYDGVHRCPSGCVATAMAQIMYFYRYPETGTGEYGYRWYNADSTRTDSLYAHFGSTRYLWNQMRNSYKSVSPVYRPPIAQLLYHCGVSVDMRYDSSSKHQSSAYTKRAPQAMAQYFGYDTNYQCLNKSIYSYDSLAALLREELKRNHPILINASNGTTGHAFICDGYNAEGYFHINWGWGGDADGYYLLPNLKPSVNPEDNNSAVYNKSLAFYVGIQPPNEQAHIFSYQMGADSLTLTRNQWAVRDTFSLIVNRMQNFGMHNYSGAYGAALLTGDSLYLLDTAKVSLKSGFYKTVLMKRDSLVLPALADGEYHLVAAYHDYEAWRQFPCRYAEPYCTIYVCGDSVYTTPQERCSSPLPVSDIAQEEEVVSKTLLMTFGTMNLYLIETRRGNTITRTKLLSPQQ